MTPHGKRTFPAIPRRDAEEANPEPRPAERQALPRRIAERSPRPTLKCHALPASPVCLQPRGTEVSHNFTASLRDATTLLVPLPRIPVLVAPKNGAPSTSILGYLLGVPTALAVSV